MRVVFIDPGISGAIALIDTQTKRHEVHDIPIMVLGSKRKAPNPYALGELLTQLKPDVVGIEYVVPIGKKQTENGTFRHTGMASTGDFMYGAGVLYGVAGALGAKVEFVMPAVWKRFFHLIGKSKEASRSLAIRKFPKLSSSLARKKDDGRAEALLMALWYASCIGP